MKSRIAIAIVFLACVALFVVGASTYERCTIAGRFVAKELCSCLFVTGQSEPYCRIFASAGPTWMVEARIDLPHRRVTTRSARLFEAAAHDRGNGQGCAFER